MPFETTSVSTLTGMRRCCFRKVRSDGRLMGERLESFRKLSQAAIDIIKALPKYENCLWLIPNPETKKPFVSIKHPWQKALKDARLPDLRIHDLRHSAASFMINSGVDLFAVGKVLGHADYKSTMRYSHLANETLLSAVEAGASKLIGQWG